MTPFAINELALPAISIFIVTLFITLYFTKWIGLSIIAAFIKAGVFIIYFGLLFDGTYTFLDDYGYLDGGSILLREEVGINIWDNWDLLTSVGRGSHFLYYLYNAYAFTIFGEGYFAPVALNIILTVIIAYLGAKLAFNEFNITRRAAKILYFFLLFHPDIFAWSNVMNGKDILVLLMHLLLLIAIAAYFRSQYMKCFLIGACAIFMLFFMRFYVPVLFAFAVLLSAFIASRRGKLKYIAVSMVLLVLILTWMGDSTITYATNEISQNFVNPIYGLPRIILTPIPFNTEVAYAFLNIPALIHWGLMPFVILGFINIWRINSRFSRLFCLYALTFLALYAVYGELQGPRHRVQLDYAWGVFQFIGVVTAFNLSKRRTYRPVRTASI